MDTSVALIIAKTLSASLRFIRLTEPVVIIEVTVSSCGSDNKFRYDFVGNNFLHRARQAVSDTRAHSVVFRTVSSGFLRTRRQRETINGRAPIPMADLDRDDWKRASRD